MKIDLGAHSRRIARFRVSQGIRTKKAEGYRVIRMTPRMYDAYTKRGASCLVHLTTQIEIDNGLYGRKLQPGYYVIMAPQPIADLYNAAYTRSIRLRRREVLLPALKEFSEDNALGVEAQKLRALIDAQSILRLMREGA